MTSVLDPVRHKLLIADIENIAAEAGVTQRYIERSMTEECGETEIEWVKSYRDHVEKGCYGLCYVTTEEVSRRMMATAGAFVRNFVDARVRTLAVVLDEWKTGLFQHPTVLLIPSFHRPTGMKDFQINALWDLLEERMLKELQTVLHIQSLPQIGNDYGQQFRSLIENHYQLVAG